MKYKIWRANLHHLVAILAVVFVGSIFATPADAKRKDNFDRMEDVLRDPSNGIPLLALYRTYLPESGRRANPLPSIQKITMQGMEDPLPECLLTSRIHVGEVNFRSLLRDLAAGRGDQIDFIVELARILEIPVPRGKGQIIGRYPYCAWWGFVDEKFLNWIFPDATATYWFQPFLAPPDADDEFPQYFVKGDFVNERYKSFALYDISFNPYQYRINRRTMVNTTVTDFQMKPSNGFNPFQRRGLERNYGNFQILLKNNPTIQDTRLPETNILPLQDNTGGDQVLTGRASGKIPLPVPCGRTNSTFPCPVEGMPMIPSANLEQGVVSNTSNAYVFTITNQLTPRLLEPLQERPKAIVIRGRIPRTPGSVLGQPGTRRCRDLGRSNDVCYCQRNPGTCEPIPWTGPSNVFNPNQDPPYSGPALLVDRERIDMRYWSICASVMQRPYPTIGNILPQNRFRQNTGCVPDSDIIQTNEKGEVDPDGGWFTVVITSPAGMPTVFTEEYGGIRNVNAGANWVQGVSGLKIGINTRQMFPNDDFAESGTRAEADSSWTSTFETMQEYYPQITAVCSTAIINARGWSGCWAPRVPADTCGGVPGCVNPPVGEGSSIGIPGAVTASQ